MIGCTCMHRNLLSYRVRCLLQCCLLESYLREAPLTKWWVTGQEVNWEQVEEPLCLQLVETVLRLHVEDCRAKEAES